jgi:MFS family permease
MITWGAVSMCQGATQTYAGMLACRFFLGMMEAGYYPGVLYHLSFWYPAEKMALRIAFFYACGQFSGTISGLLAFGVSFMDGVGGLAGWRWVFILEGIPAILCGVHTLFFLPNYPGPESKFLSSHETQVLLDDLPETQPNSKAKTWDFSQVKALLKDPTFPTFTLIWACHAIGGWGISTVLPTVSTLLKKYVQYLLLTLANTCKVIFELGLTDSAVSQLMTMVRLTGLGAALIYG